MEVKANTEMTFRQSSMCQSTMNLKCYEQNEQNNLLTEPFPMVQGGNRYGGLYFL